MPLDLQKFAGTLPYASELFGVYQPLIGWRSARGTHRAVREQRGTIAALVDGMARDPRFRRAVAADKLPKGPDAKLPPLAPAWLNRAIGSLWQDALTRFEREHGRKPRTDEWEAVVRGLHLAEAVKTMASTLSRSGRMAEPLDVSLVHVTSIPHEQLVAMGGVKIEGTDLAIVRKQAGSTTGASAAGRSIATEAAAQAGTIAYLAAHAPGALGAAAASKAIWETIAHWIDPLAHFDPDTQDGVLSPLGMVHLYRQYFFELDSFLGPPVGHVWVSPGGSLELFEVHTRKTLEERTIESRVQTMTREEKQSVVEDELASKVGAENSSNVSLGVTASVGYSCGVWQASATASFGYQSAQRSSHETAHKNTRKQSQKIADEMRRDYKTTFRTSVETQDTSSRRYVLANTTDKLVNYEFRRKMRQVGVQLQHVGLQMCWQTYVDHPGARLAIPELVHLAQRGDLTGQLQPPEAPPAPEPVDQDFDVMFPYSGPDGRMGESYVEGKDDAPLFLFFDLDEPGIKCVKDFAVTPPASGFELTNVKLKDVQGSDPEKDPPSPIDVQVVKKSATSFTVKLTRINFKDNPAVRIFVSLTFAPGKALLDSIDKAFDEKKKEYEQAKARAAHAEYVRAVRERVTLASRIERRAGDDLRAEERCAIFDRLLAELRPGAGDEPPHVSVELIRSIFDVEKMLYFVSESWWMPQKRYQPRYYDAPGETLSSADQIGWDGTSGAKKKAAGAAPYHITEESTPAPAGASLGWLLQLDGDEHRNAFLNSPFVKAVIPIRPGKELAAMAWLERAHVEGAEGLDTPYRGTEGEFAGKTIRQVLKVLAGRVASDNGDNKNTLATEKVFETGFDPLEGGFVAQGKPFEIFDQWIEVLPTEQVVAVEYGTT